VTDLPFVDQHAVLVEASAACAWTAVGAVVSGAFTSRGAGVAARALGCSDTQARGSPLERGSTVPGFRVARVEPARDLVLAGEHRFSRYALILRIEQLPDGRTRVRAETHAAFPGLPGQLYRAAVIGTRGHVLVVHRLLAAVRRRAERAEGDDGTVDRPRRGSSTGRAALL
jgi:hypothetical protein